VSFEKRGKGVERGKSEEKNMCMEKRKKNIKVKKKYLCV
jgi:hypothetical protein